jgi:hypothetical protein
MYPPGRSWRLRHPGRPSTAAADSLPHYEAEARKRQVAGGKEKVPEKIPEAIKGDARDHAARDFKVNPHYIADAKALREEGFIEGKERK